jgi:hypothetical protein
MEKEEQKLSEIKNIPTTRKILLDTIIFHVSYLDQSEKKYCEISSKIKKHS